MRITFQAAEANQTTERYKTENRESTVQRIGTGKGYALDISDTVKDNEIYKGQGRTTEDVMQEAGMQDVALTRDYMAVMSNSMSDEEFGKLQEDGFRPGDMEIENAVTIVDQIKASLVQAGVSVSGYTDTLDVETLTEIAGNEGLARDMATAFSEAGVPLTEDTAKESMQALEEAETLSQPEGDTLKYLITNGKSAVIEDLYMAQYSSRVDTGRQGRGYYQDANGYLSRKADSTDLEGLQPQIDKILEEAGMTDTEGAKEAANWLIRAGIPLTQKTLQSYMQFAQIQMPMNRKELLQAMATAVSDGKEPKQASLTGANSLWQQASEIWNQMQEITGEAADLTVQQGKSLTLQHLSEAQKQIDSNRENNISISNMGENITARRKLEEVRLQMTITANRELLKSGYAIETTELEQLVEALREMEHKQNQRLFSGENVQETQIRAQYYSETLSIVSRIPQMPIAVVGKLADSSLKQVEAEGEALEAAYKKAGERYETFRTQPDRELGDSIRKAFRNADVLLEELQMEATEANRRAVRILGYNHLEISEENLMTVKAADQALSNVVNKMTPAAVLKMIRDGKNPLEMTVEQLDDYLAGEQQEAEAEQEKFSKFLYKLEQKEEISEAEKESYIGIFRLLRQIEKTDGAVIGSLLHQGAELSFRNLLTAVRTYRAKPIDTLVDDELGTVQEVVKKEAGIDAQIESAFTKEASLAEKEADYYKGLAREAYDRLDGDTITAAAPTAEIGLENFVEQLREIKEEEDSEKAYRRQQLSQFRKLSAVSIEQTDFLRMLEEPVTLQNISAAEEYRKGIENAFMKIRKEADNNSSKEKNEFVSAVSQLEEAFIGKEEAQAAYQTLAEAEKEILEKAMYEKVEVTSLDVKELGLIYKQVSFTAKLAETEQYEIPLITEDSVMALHLQIVHSDENRGMVEATMKTERYGKLSVRIQIQENTLKGIFVTAQQEYQKGLDELKNQMTDRLSQAGFEQEKAEKATAIEEKTSTAELYRAAKVVIHVMQKQAERG